MKVTRNTTMEQLKDALNANFKEVQKKDKALADSIKYASEQLKKDPKAVKKADLAELVKQTMTVMGDKFKEAITPAPTLTPVAENSTKPASKPAAKLTASNKTDTKGQKSDKKDNTTPAPTPATGKTDKPAAKPADTKKDANKTDSGKKAPVQDAPVTADVFPKELTVGDTTYVLADDIKTMEDLLNGFNKDEEFIFAFYWSKSYIKKYGYSDSTGLPAPASFDNDLDLASTLYVSDDKKVAYHLSMYTEALYQTMPDSFEVIEGIRYSKGIEFQIYRAQAAQQTEKK